MAQPIDAFLWMLFAGMASLIIVFGVISWFFYLIGKHWIQTWGEQCRLTKMVPESKPTESLPPTKFDALREARNRH